MHQFSSENFEKMKKGLQLYNDEMFWECHEELEDVWLEDRNDPIRYVYWAVIQVASSLYHYQDKNLVGARSLLVKAKEKLKKCEELYIESEYLEKQLTWSQFKSVVRKVPDDPTLEHFDLLFTFKFPKEEL